MEASATANGLLQLTRQTVSGPWGTLLDQEYRYPAGQNNGRIVQSKDWLSGEEVTYTYDGLQRLVKAETTLRLQTLGILCVVSASAPPR